MKSLKTILVIDLGSQTTALIARRIREAGVCTEILASDATAQEVKKHNPIGIILSGSPFSLHEEGRPSVNMEILDLGVPVLGICFGLYVIADKLGGKVLPGQREYGPTQLKITDKNLLFDGVPEDIQVWMNHEGQAQELQSSSKISASTTACKYASFYNEEKQFYAMQFHPEVSHTDYGQKMLENFAFKICKAEKNWQLKDWAKEKIQNIEKDLDGQKALCAVSGGVDSTVAAVLCSKAIGQNLYCVLVDTGLMRANEISQVTQELSKHSLNLTVVDAKERFFKKLKGVTDPEEKRKIIGHEYIEIFDEEANKFGGIKYLIQGTIYSDKIESNKTSAHSSNIKSHHNVGGLPEKMNLKVYEPLDFLFKDEVRKIGAIIGVPPAITNRHPFPGPGLAIQLNNQLPLTYQKSYSNPKSNSQTYKFSA